MKGWYRTAWGERNHAVTTEGWPLCGLVVNCGYPPDPDAKPCARCLDCAGPAMPPPPGGWPTGHRRAEAPSAIAN